MNLSETKKALLLLMDYAVDPEDRESAITLLEKYASDHIALNIFHEFYSYLPDAQNDCIRVIRQLDHREGTFLTAVSTNIDTYLYVTNHEGALFLGTAREGIWDEEVLDFFKLTRQMALVKYQKIAEFPLYVPAHINRELCKVCSVKDGEFHRFGCPVEICPWCHGQLANCNCRFAKAGQNELKTDAQLDKFLKKVEEKGRIPFSAVNQNISFATTKELTED
jgi:hypothetical protein